MNTPVRRMPDRWSGRIGDVVELGMELRASCIVCDHESAIDAAQLSARYGEYEFLKHLETKCRCTNCGGRAATLKWRYVD